jgi:hypothetical protein
MAAWVHVMSAICACFISKNSVFFYVAIEIVLMHSGSSEKIHAMDEFYETMKNLEQSVIYYCRHLFDFDNHLVYLLPNDMMQLEVFHILTIIRRSPLTPHSATLLTPKDSDRR